MGFYMYEKVSMSVKVYDHLAEKYSLPKTQFHDDICVLSESAVKTVFEKLDELFNRKLSSNSFTFDEVRLYTFFCVILDKIDHNEEGDMVFKPIIFS